MKNLMTAIATGLFLMGCSDDDSDSNLSEAVTFEQLNPVNIPDPQGCGVHGLQAQSILAVSAIGTIADPAKVTIELSLAHPFGGDLLVELVAPDGSSCALIKRLGNQPNSNLAAAANFIVSNPISFNALNVMEFDVQLPTDEAYPAGNYAIYGQNATHPTSVQMISLTDFLQSKSVQGDWQIHLSDFCGADTGSLERWKIKFDEGALDQ